MMKYIRLLVIAGSLSVTICQNVFAHAYGKLGVDRYIRITPQTNAVKVEYDVHLGTFPTASISIRLDSDRNGTLSKKEILAYMNKAAPVYRKRLSLRAGWDGKHQSMSILMPPGGIANNAIAHMVLNEDKEKTLRMRWIFTAPWPKEIVRHYNGPINLKIESVIKTAKCGSIFTTGKTKSPVRIVSSDIPTDEEKPLPPDITPTINDLSQIPKAMAGNIVCCLKHSNAATESISLLTQEPPEEIGGAVISTANMRKAEIKLQDRILMLFKPPLSRYSWTLAILLCMAWGATHALSPGHGKVIVSSYLVGAHGTYRHALLLGIILTITHTSVVMILAVAAYILKDRFVFPVWLAPLGAIMILLVGVNQIRIGLLKILGHGHHHGHDHKNAHDHNHHGHSHHLPKQGASVSSRDLLIVGASGGIVPCPAAIIMLLLAWQVKAPALGLACLISFSIGLAATLTLVGFLAVSGTKLVMRWLAKKNTGEHHHLQMEAVIPILGGIVLIACGIIILSNV
ncbi:MAG: hypothetical protein KAH23_08240 [Kiritimatiellae bacterium]|nr:hypothetical protein [Kiritimatiellia bacterium]